MEITERWRLPNKKYMEENVMGIIEGKYRRYLSCVEFLNQDDEVVISSTFPLIKTS